MNVNVKSPLRRTLAMLLCVAMLMGLAATASAAVPETAADGTTIESATADGNVQLRKTVTLENDGTYTIDLEAWTLGKEVETTIPLDVVMVIDYSGSMYCTYGSNYITVDRTTNTFTEYTKVSDDSFKKRTLTEEEKAEVIENAKVEGYYINCTEEVTGWNTTQIRPVLYENGIWKEQLMAQSDNGMCYADLDQVQRVECSETITLRPTRMAATLDSIESFVTSLHENGLEKGVNHRISITTFSCNSTCNEGDNYRGTNLYINGVETEYSSSITSSDFYATLEDVTSTNGYNTIMGIVDLPIRHAGRNTCHEMGVKLAKDVLDSRTADEKENRQSVVIFYTDGQNDKGYPDTAIDTAYNMKKSGTLIYSVGIFATEPQKDDDDTVWEILNYISSDYPNAISTTDGGTQITNPQYYANGSNPAALLAILDNISSSTTEGTTATLDASATLRDYMASGFALTASSDVEIYTADYLGNSNWASKVSADSSATASKSLDENYVSVVGFDYYSNYVAEAVTGQAARGKKLCVTITGVELTDSVAKDTLTNTNTAVSGIYPANSGLTLAFGQPMTKVTTKAYVMDYAKNMAISSSDWGLTTLLGVTGVTDDNHVRLNTDTANDYGKITDNGNGTYTFSPLTMQWDQAYSFYALGYNEAIAEGVTTGNNSWNKINVIPANNIYYEDDFITSTETGIVGIEYTGTWTSDGTTGNATENHEGIEGATNGGVHGWEDNLADDTGYSDGSARYADASSDSTATATFTFTGTGVDIYSRTNGSTGTVIATLKGTSDSGISISKGIIVDNLSASGDYYQIPTLSFHTYTVNGNETALPHGTYTVTIKVTTGAASENRFLYYLDGIRVYNPLADDSMYDEAEQNATFTEVRDILIDADSFDAEGGNTGAVFIDQLKEDQTSEGDSTAETTPTITNAIGVYEDYGPKNEVYLQNGQFITFKVDKLEGQHFYIGLKSPNITAQQNDTLNIGKAKVSAGENVKETVINHSTDLYYQVEPDSDGFITIQNTGDGLLSVTKIRTTGTASGLMLLSVTEEEAVNSVAAFSLRAVVETEEETEDTETPTEPETPDVEIDNPDPEPEEEVDTAAQLKDLLIKLFKKLFNWFG